MKDRTFLKSILFSILIHIIGISLFSISLPLPLKKRKPVEIIQYPSFTKKTSEKVVLKEIESIGTENVRVFQNVVPVNISNRDIIGEKEYVSKVNFKIDIEPTKFEISLPEIPLTQVYAEIKREEEIIEGPAGSRKIVYKEKIEYPFWAQKKGIEGKVKIKFWVNPEGKIIDTEIFSSSGYPEIDLYAEENFKKWVFDIAKSDKNVWGIITIIFKLK
ncbi:MAG: energy transducer TonB [Candidatus Omnitrophica bacterium]|nr:energy transducer TonB [Candidatus Omnitrophota bacterium]